MGACGWLVSVLAGSVRHEGFAMTDVSMVLCPDPECHGGRDTARASLAIGDLPCPTCEGREFVTRTFAEAWLHDAPIEAES